MVIPKIDRAAQPGDAIWAAWSIEGVKIAIVFYLSVVNVSAGIAAQYDKPIVTVGDAIGVLREQSARTNIRMIAKCLISSDRMRLTAPRAKLIAFMRLPSQATAITSTARMLVRSNCRIKDSDLLFGSIEKFTFPPEILRGQLFRALYLSRPLKYEDNFVESIRSSWSLTENDPMFPLQRLGDCVVKKDRRLADRAIRNKPGRAAENEAYRALAPILTACAAEAGTESPVRVVLEGVVSEALYKQAVLTPSVTNRGQS